ncbi:MAG TPA: GGDEF domain-containing protein [Dongiaceae bacterium]|nr:GGDEF domain-containing protein [Dongiaceae bacterium]
MTAVAQEAALLGAALLSVAGATVVAARARTGARRDGSLRAREPEADLAGAARRLAHAARESAGAVRHVVADAVRAVAPCADGVLVYEERDGALACAAAFGERFAYYPGAVVPFDDDASLAARALATTHRVTLADDGVRAPHPSDASALAVPLVLDAGRACVLVVCSRHELGAAAVDRIVALAEQASPAYAIALDREHDRRCAEYDGLTGLLTPGAFRRRLAELVERARFVPSAPLALAFADTDHFKHWNDRYGHAAGDALLRELAQVLRASCSPRDVVARNGGDEFCVVFLETGKAAAIERAEALRRRIAAIDLSALRPPGACARVDISASIGVAAFPADASTASELLERADAAMYHSKHTGRDGVSFLGATGEPERLDSGPGAGFVRSKSEGRA